MTKQELEQEADKLDAIAQRAKLSFMNADTLTRHERQEVDKLLAVAAVARQRANEAK